MGRRVLGERRLQGGDEIRIGRTKLTLRIEEPKDETETQSPKEAPALTSREREVLVALCQPLFSGDLFTEPASIRQMASELVVTEAAIKQHLLHLYDKFGIYDKAPRRRVRLANEAIRRGAVGLGELRAARDLPGK